MSHLLVIKAFMLIQQQADGFYYPVIIIPSIFWLQREFFQQ